MKMLLQSLGKGEGEIILTKTDLEKKSNWKIILGYYLYTACPVMT